MSDTKYTCDEIITMFKECKDINDEFKGLVLTRLNATLQAMYNAVHESETTMRMSDTYGDWWEEEHNRFVMEYQRYHN